MTDVLRRSSLFIWVTGNSPSPSLVIANDIRHYQLPNNLTRGVIGLFLLPQDVNLTENPLLAFGFTVLNAGAADADVRLRVTTKYLAVGDLESAAASETLLQTVPVINTVDRIHMATQLLNRALIAAADQVFVSLERLGADAADTFTGDIGILESGSRFGYRG